MMKNFNHAMKKAFVALVLIDLVVNMLSPSDDVMPFELVNVILSYLMIFGISYFLVYLLNRIAVPTSQQMDAAFAYGVWSYVWRVYLVKSLSLFVAIVIYVIFNHGTSVTPSVSFSLLISTMSIVIAIPVMWIFFSRDRRGQFIWAMQIVRGMN
jgi:hypothetical protein